ncbi:hypothetical protein TNCV_991671, partial [Trichonephila clavipes]
FASCKVSEIVCGTIATPYVCSYRVERVTVGPQVLPPDPSIPPSLEVTPVPGFRAWVPSSCPLPPNNVQRHTSTIHPASSTARRPDCSFQPDDQASQTRLTVRNVFQHVYLACFAHQSLPTFGG